MHPFLPIYPSPLLLSLSPLVPLCTPFYLSTPPLYSSPYLPSFLYAPLSTYLPLCLSPLVPLCTPFYLSTPPLYSSPYLPSFLYAPLSTYLPLPFTPLLISPCSSMHPFLPIYPSPLLLCLSPLAPLCTPFYLSTPPLYSSASLPSFLYAPLSTYLPLPFTPLLISPRSSMHPFLPIYPSPLPLCLSPLAPLCTPFYLSTPPLYSSPYLPSFLYAPLSTYLPLPFTPLLISPRSSMHPFLPIYPSPLLLCFSPLVPLCTPFYLSTPPLYSSASLPSLLYAPLSTYLPLPFTPLLLSPRSSTHPFLPIYPSPLLLDSSLSVVILYLFILSATATSKRTVRPRK